MGLPTRDQEDLQDRIEDLKRTIEEERGSLEEQKKNVESKKSVYKAAEDSFKEIQEIARDLNLYCSYFFNEGGSVSSSALPSIDIVT